MTKEIAHYIFKEIHKRDCVLHVEGSVLVGKVLKVRVYWLTLVRGALDYVIKYKICLLYSIKIHIVATNLFTSVKPIPFVSWGMDIQAFFFKPYDKERTY